MGVTDDAVVSYCATQMKKKKKLPQRAQVSVPAILLLLSCHRVVIAVLPCRRHLVPRLSSYDPLRAVVGGLPSP
jgi:hypothetical protein